MYIQVKGDVGGNYKKMMRYALMERDEFVSQVIDEACKGLGTNETLLIDVSWGCCSVPVLQVLAWFTPVFSIVKQQQKKESCRFSIPRPT